MKNKDKDKLREIQTNIYVIKKFSKIVHPTFLTRLIMNQYYGALRNIRKLMFFLKSTQHFQFQSIIMFIWKLYLRFKKNS